MPGKCRPSLREKTLEHVMRSNLSETDKQCIKNVFERFVDVVRCKDCKHWECGDCYRLELSRPDDYCSYGERRADNADEIKCPCGLRDYMEDIDCEKTLCCDCCPLQNGEADNESSV